jgi:hypothetical protein
MAMTGFETPARTRNDSFDCDVNTQAHEELQQQQHIDNQNT